MTTIETTPPAAPPATTSPAFNIRVLFAVFKRNFLSYFASPTGYVFICLFVFMCSVAAFLPAAFFNVNEANLDQLNYWIPLIMLVFIPAITMSIWADEARQGTDELLLTMPASDFDIVVGKYLASVAIFTVSLLFSMACNYLNLKQLGNPDVGLYLSTYFGYWLLGVAMLAIGMVASFLTRNLTVAYILGAAFSAPLTLLSWSDRLPAFGKHFGAQIRQWSFGGMFDSFGRGVFSLAGFCYFFVLASVMLYLCMILIGRRHWMLAGEWLFQGFHFFIRTLALLVIGFSVVYIFHNHDRRLDVTSEQLTALSPHTVDLLNELRDTYNKADAAHKRAVRIEAFVSPEVPENYVQTRENLLSVLGELKSRGGDMLEVQINPTDRYGAEADMARKRYNIEPKQVSDKSQGVYRQEGIYMAAAFTCGLQKVVIPFFDRGVPVEYELVRSLCTVTEQKRKRVGVVETDAPLFGRFSMQGQSNPWRLIDELKKQYEVVQVDPKQPIPLHKAAKTADEKDEGFDVLLAVQPSSLGPPEMKNFIDAVKAGQPAVIFEDPFLFFAPDVPGTSAPRHQQDNNPMMGMMPQQHLEKGDIKALWKMLGITFAGAPNSNNEFSPFPEDESMGGKDHIIWERYNPYPKLGSVEPEFIFIDKECDAKQPFNENDPISSKLQQLFFVGPGYIEKLNYCELKDSKFIPLVNAGTQRGGTVEVSKMMTRGMMGGMTINPFREESYKQDREKEKYTLAAHITGEYVSQPADMAGKAPDAKKSAAAPKEANVNVVLVADVDMLTDIVFSLREQNDNPLDLVFNFDNVPFVLNAIDSLAGDTRFLELRKRRPEHRTLANFDASTREANKLAIEKREERRKKHDEDLKNDAKDIEEKQAKYRKELESGKKDPQEVEREFLIAVQTFARERDEKKRDEDLKMNEDIRNIDDHLEEEVHRKQGIFEAWATILPPLPPLVLAGLVFFIRRAKETEGVSKRRLV